MERVDWRGARLYVAVLLTSLVFSPILSRAAAEQSSKPVIALDDATHWQPPGGEIRFTITPYGDSGLPTACLGWKADECPVPLTVRRVSTSTGTPQVVTFAAALPPDLGQDDAWKQKARSYYPDLTINGRPLMPREIFSAAYLRVTVGDAQPVPFRVAITSRLYAATVTLLAVVLAGWALFRFAKYLGVPGPRKSNVFRLWSVPLRLISTANGWASLSQFQILLWTFVVGAGAVYVMTLSGSLIPLSAGTLMLLGIAGGAAVLTEVKANQPSEPGSGMERPGKVQNLTAVDGQPSTELLIRWVAPTGRAPISGYTVQYYDVHAAPIEWIEASRLVRGTDLRIVGLKQDTEYKVRVCATNPAGDSDPAEVDKKTSAAVPPQASILNVRTLPTDITEKSIALAWDPVPNATCIVQCRRADSDQEWTDAKVQPPMAGSPANVIVTSLRSGTRYQFRVRTDKAADAWSSVATSATIHLPKWSDIVTDTDRPAEIDVTRVQMLFFTVISAFFVGLRIVDTGTIPEIPGTYVTLMGISNGVYIITKFVRNY